MASICPKDMHPCVDDLCRGSGVCLVTQTELLEQCPVCHQPYQYELSIPCGCEPNDNYPNEDGEL